MNKIMTIVLFCLFACTQVQAASFDCNQAKSTSEKLICSSEELSALDTKLSDSYRLEKQNANLAEAKRLTEDQLRWLRTRNRCTATACLLKAYKNRLNELDPFADNQLTCDEMRKFPERIFSGEIDLGSGSGSPIEVDYKCPESLSQQKFMQRLLALAEQIRGDGGPQVCTGSIVHALWRYYYHSLSEAGFAPWRLLRSEAPFSVDADWKSLAGADGSENDTVFLYFKQWSEQSVVNSVSYADFTSEVERVLPTLVKHYENKLGLTGVDAQHAARFALMIVVKRAAGSFPSSELKSEPFLVQLARNNQATQDDIRQELSGGSRDSKRQSDEDIYQSLRVALIHNRSVQIVSSLADRLSPEFMERLGVGKEPLLSLALGSEQNLEYLLNRKVSVNAANEFGKTSLFYAIGANNYKAVETLLKSGADVNHAYKSAKELRPSDDECAYFGLFHTRRTPLMHAAQHSDVQMLNLLIKAGASLGAVDDLGYNALDYAVLGKNKDNENHLKSFGLEFGAPIYTSDPNSSVREQKIQESIVIDGYVSKLHTAPGRPDILVAAVHPWNTLVAGNKHGLYLISIADPEHPKVISTLAAVYAHDFALSPDGKRAYVIELANDKEPADKKFGLSIVDITIPEKPALTEKIEGDFMTMHLSPDGKLLYLQERALKAEFSRGLLVYDVGSGKAKIKCSNPFGKVEVYGPIFAYSFTSFPDEPLLLIHDRSRRLILFDVKDPCAPIKLTEIRSENLGDPIFGAADRTIVSGSSGALQKFHIADSLQRVAGYQASTYVFYVNATMGFVTAAIGKDVVVFRTKLSGQWVLTDRFRIPFDNVGSVLQTNSGYVYIGWKGGLGVGHIPAQ